MTLLLVPPPPLSPVQEDLPQDIEFDFHMDFSLDPLPALRPPAPAPQDYPESEHEVESLRLSRTSQASIYSQYSSRTSLPSVPPSGEDSQSSAFWGNFGVSSDNLDQDSSDMTAPLKIVKRERSLSEHRLSERRGGDRSGEFRAPRPHHTNRFASDLRLGAIDPRHLSRSCHLTGGTQPSQPAHNSEEVCRAVALRLRSPFPHHQRRRP